jgi:hypothetical protein
MSVVGGVRDFPTTHLSTYPGYDNRIFSLLRIHIIFVAFTYTWIMDNPNLDLDWDLDPLPSSTDCLIICRYYWLKSGRNLDETSLYVVLNLSVFVWRVCKFSIL